MADKRIDELEEATSITANDLFVLEQAATAKKLSGQTMTTFLLTLANGHGGIANIAKTSSSGTNPVVDTYTITFADASTTTFTVTNGVKGNTGATGAQGPKGDNITISSYSVNYQVGDSGTSAPTGTWSPSVPSVPQGFYLWTRIIINYSDGTGMTSYSVSRMGIDGSGAVSTVNNVNPDGNGNVQLTASDVGAMPDTYIAPVTSVNNKTGTVALTASDVSAVPTSGSDGFLVRNSNSVAQKELYKTLWTGSWSSGSITVDTSDYNMFVLSLDGYDTKITAYKSDDGSVIQGVGGFPYSSTTDTMYYFSASVSGDTLTMNYCRSRPSSSTTTSARTIAKIVGVI